MKESKIFLGGTYNSKWRESLIPHLTINYFNPVVEDWTEDCREEEIAQKNNLCNVHLYYIDHNMTGVFSIAEAVNSAHTKGIKTIFIYDGHKFTKSQIKSLDAVHDMLFDLGADVYYINTGHGRPYNYSGLAKDLNKL